MVEKQVHIHKRGFQNLGKIIVKKMAKIAKATGCLSYAQYEMFHLAMDEIWIVGCIRNGQNRKVRLSTF